MKKSLLTSSLVLSLLAGTFVPTVAPAFAEETTEVAEEESSEADEEETTEADEEETTEADEEEASEEETTEADDEEESSDVDWDALKEDMQEILEAETMDTEYKSLKPIKIETGVEGIEFTINGYYYYKVTNVDDGWEISFGDQTETGGVIVLDVTLKNDTKDPIYPVPSFDLTATGDTDYILRSPSVVKDKVSLNSIFYQDEEGVLEAGKEVRGFLPFTASPTSVEKIDAEGFVMMETPFAYSKEEFSSDSLLVSGESIRLPLSAAGEESVAEAGNFYPDKFTAENWGKKTIVSEGELGETIESEGLAITVAGYQLTELEPNEDYVDRFSEFEDGAYLLTLDVQVENNSEEDMTLSQLSGDLTMADMVSYFNELLLEMDPTTDTVTKDGGTGQIYQTYLMDGKTYKKFAEDTWVVELKPMTTEFDRLGEEDTFFFTIQE